MNKNIFATITGEDRGKCCHRECGEGSEMGGRRGVGTGGVRVGFSATPLGRDDSINGADLKGG